MLRGIDDRHPNATYVLLLNPDVRLDPGFVEELIRASESDATVALACGRLLRPGRERIDSAGIELPRHRRPRDRGSEAVDRGQFGVSEVRLRGERRGDVDSPCRVARPGARR